MIAALAALGVIAIELEAGLDEVHPNDSAGATSQMVLPVIGVRLLAAAFVRPPDGNP